jgi:hypothetical protein
MSVYHVNEAYTHNTIPGGFPIWAHNEHEKDSKTGIEMIYS